MVKLALVLLGIFSFPLAYAQCPVANSCTPGSAPASAFPFGMGIYNVNVGSGATGIANPTTSGASAGFQDFSCTLKATVLEGANTTISIATNPNSDENVRVWIDLNNDGSFNATTELVYSSNNARTHTGNFTIPVSASTIKNQVLRLRVSSDDNASPIPTPCSTPKFGQVEDYGITILPNLSKPATDFTVDKTITCSPTVQFTNLVQNGATSYLWSFSDGTTSTLANPSKTFAGTGTYSVKLKACNANGCDSLTKTNYVTYHTNVPIAATCTPATTSYCCGYGITKVTFHTMVNSSQNGSAGYEDFTCTKSVTVEEGSTYSVSIETGPTNNQDTWIYIDYNNDGSFSSNELVFSRLNAKNPFGSILVGPAQVHNTPVRMRVISDAIGTGTGACANRTNGQAEDYTVIVAPNTRRPLARFKTNFTSVCDTVIQFTDTSSYVPTSWLWDFGDGSPKSTQRNPQHAFAANKSYSIKLKVCNAVGCDSITKVNSLTFTRPCLPYCVPNNTYKPDYWLNVVNLNTIFNTSTYKPGNHEDFTNLSTTLDRGSSYTISTYSNNGTALRKNRVWIDYNQDGDFFDPGELVAESTTLQTAVSSFVVPINAKAGITRMRVSSCFSNSFPEPCFYGSNSYSNNSEDYSIIIPPTPMPPVANFNRVNSGCSFSVNFTDSSGYSPTSWLWDFGDPGSGQANTSTLQNPSHTYSAPGVYHIGLTACNGYGCHSTVRINHVRITTNNGPRTASCKPKIIFYSPTYGMGIISVNLNTISNSPPNTVGSSTGYQDYACTLNTNLVQGQNYTLTVNTSNNAYSNVRAWIDYNDDGNFDPVNELVLSSDRRYIHNVTFSPPSTAVLNKPLRLRIAQEHHLNQPTVPCWPISSGEVEDYSVTIINTTGIRDNLFADKLKLYPNPSNGTFSLEIPTVLNGNFQIEVQNLVGQTLVRKDLEANQSLHRLNFTTLPKGIYFIKVFNAEVAAVKKIVIE